MSSRTCFVWMWMALMGVLPANAATISGVVTDTSGAAVVATRVVVRDVATRQEIVTETGEDGRYTVETPTSGTYLVSVAREGFSEAVETVIVERADQVIDVPLRLQVGTVTSAVVVTASRAERDTRQIPLHVEAITKAAVEQSNQLSTGDALTLAANITPVGNGPFGVRPRLRGLDSTRLLVLVDGERLNTARQATDRTGAEVGLVSPDSISRMEIVNGAGTLMYGSDALAGTINIITNEAAFTPQVEWLYGFNGFYSSNENGMRGTGTVGVTTPRFTVRVQAGAEDYDNYQAGDLDSEDTRPLFASGVLDQADTIDDNFGFRFNAFPDPFNAPYVRTDNEVLNSQARGNFVNVTGSIKVGDRRSVRLRYQRRRMEDVGFPDFAAPYFFNATALPHSNLDRVSARYEAQAITPWLANLSVTSYFQRTERLLQNALPVQFPAPTAGAFFPISVMRLDILSETEQRVWTPGVDVQAVFVPASRHLLTTGLTFYRDRSSDQRTTTTTTSLAGLVALGSRGPAPVVFPNPVQLGPPSTAHPVRVPDASFRDIAVFAQDEWRLRPSLSLVAGLRGDFFNVSTEATQGYNVDAVAAGARPPIDPATLPDPNGATYTRQSLTGDIGLVANQGGTVSPFIRFGRSYRHPNLEEMLFAGPATVGSIVPNVTVKPETGNNFDTGAKFVIGRVSGGAYFFVNQYQDFISQDFVAVGPSGPIAQAINYADVRISGIEFTADAPIPVGRGVLTIATAGALTRGSLTEGVNPLNGESLDGTPADNITPSRILVAIRYTEPRGRWWAEYGFRGQGEVSRVARTLLESPFLIAQDLLSLDGIAVHRIGWGVNLARGRDRVGLSFAVENLTDDYYREQFQFAPARGRSFTVGLNLGAF
jgi:hemoglobin/transferrin/lactoferrin receptor protein